MTTADDIRAAIPHPVKKAKSRVEAARSRAVRAAAPYVLSYGSTLVAAGVADAALHVPPMAPLPVAVAAAAVTHAVIRLHEARGWHRSGGKAAMRQRRRRQGMATRRELAQSLSPAAVRKRAPVTCPGIDPAEAPVVIARAKGQDLAGSPEDSFLLVAPPRAGKSALMACWLADASGPALATSTRTDLYAHTAIPRARRGRLWVLNPDGDGDIPSTLTWSPVDGCEVPAIAMQRAGYLMDAAPHDPSGKDAHWDAKGKDMLQYLLHAAALMGESIMTVRGWASDPARAGDAVAVLQQGPAPAWAAGLVALVRTSATDERYWSAISSGVLSALAWLDDPVLARMACPAPGEGFNAARFLIEGTDTVYLIAADRPHGSAAPYFAAFTSCLFETAKRLASKSPGGRLPRPLTLCLDEAAITCPVPLHKWVSEAGGHGVTVQAAVQSFHQLISRWGESDGKTIAGNSTIKVFYGGDTDYDNLEAISAACGEQDTWDEVTDDEGRKTKQPRQERVIPPSRIRLLKKGEVLVLHRSTRPVIAKVTPVWDRPGWQRAPLGPGAFPRMTQPRLAIEAPRRATPMPGPAAHPEITAPGIPGCQDIIPEPQGASRG